MEELKIDVISLDDIDVEIDRKKTLKERFAELKIKGSEKAKFVRKVCKEHQKEILVFGPVLLTGGFEILKLIQKKGNLAEERKLKELFIYDKPHGMYYELSRKLNKADQLVINNRLDVGDNYFDILSDLDLLK